MGSTANPNVDRFGRAIAEVDYSPAGPSNAVGFAFDKVQPPSIVYIQRDDVLIVQAASNQTAEVVTFNVRILQPNGRVEETQAILRPGSARATVTLAVQVSEGYLISLAASAAVAVSRGQTFARAFINRPIFGATAPAQTIFADYVTTLVSSGYPNGRVLAPTEGPGNIYQFLVAAPGAGVDWNVSIPTNARWRVRCWRGTLTTSATVANRQVQAWVAQGGQTSWQVGANVNIPASTAAIVTAGAIVPYVAVDATKINLPLPPDLVVTGSAPQVEALAVVTTNLQAGDSWSSVQILVEEWLDNV